MLRGSLDRVLPVMLMPVSERDEDHQQQHYPTHITHTMLHHELILLEEVIVQIVFPLKLLCTSWADVSGSTCRVGLGLWLGFRLGCGL